MISKRKIVDMLDNNNFSTNRKEKKIMHAYTFLNLFM